ncbi:MAG: rod shape-determining protein RodA [Kiritimatiellae bacterium]|nr:rod shape-determining protein RodA [Kiritimatiellia bacterium]
MIKWGEIKAVLWRLDWWMVLVIMALMGAGIAFIYSACYRHDDLPVSLLYQKQIVWCGVGFGFFLTVLFVDYRRLGENALWLYLVGLVLLLLVLLVGKKVYGAYRWLSFFGIQVQPSEFAKLSTLVALAAYLGRPDRDVRRMETIAVALGIMLVPFLLILKEPDLGTAMVLVPMVFGMLFVAGMPMRILLFLLFLGMLVLPVSWLVLSPYQKDRLMVFVDPDRDPLGAGWNMVQSIIAVGSGGVTGKGFLQGTQNILGFLPRTVAPTDFIYSVIAEETGFVGSMVIMGLYVLLLSFCIRAAGAARDRFGRLLAVGAAIMMCCHVFVNLAMTVGLMPITGLPLPLISYGGSFMVGTMISLGIVQSVYVRRVER